MHPVVTSPSYWAPSVRLHTEIGFDATNTIPLRIGCNLRWRPARQAALKWNVSISRSRFRPLPNRWLQQHIKADTFRRETVAITPVAPQRVSGPRSLPPTEFGSAKTAPGFTEVVIDKQCRRKHAWRHSLNTSSCLLERCSKSSTVVVGCSTVSHFWDRATIRTSRPSHCSLPLPLSKRPHSESCL